MTEGGSDRPRRSHRRSGFSLLWTDAEGVERGRETLTLTNNRLDGEPVPIAVTTDIVIPPRSVNVLNVEGTVYKRDGLTPAGTGFDVVVTVGK